MNGYILEIYETHVPVMMKSLVRLLVVVRVCSKPASHQHLVAETPFQALGQRTNGSASKTLRIGIGNFAVSDQ